MFILFHASSSHPPLTTTSSSFRVRNKGKVKVESEKKEKKKKSQVSGAAIFWIRFLGC